MNNFLKYKTSSPAGDLISFLAGVKKVWEDTGRKAIIYQRLNMPGVATPTSIHPFKNDEGDEVCMNEYMFDKLRPLLLSQEYIEDFEDGLWVQQFNSAYCTFFKKQIY